MKNDLVLVLGSIITLLAIPSLIGAFSESRAPRAAAAIFVIGGGMMAFAVTQQPGGYSLQEMPDVFARVVGQFLR